MLQVGISYVFLFVFAATALLSAMHALPEGRIVAGDNTQVQYFPYIVSLRGASGKHTCGGSIIAASWVLTAAHCVASKVASDVSVQYGVTEIAAQGVNVAAVQRIIIHEAFENQYPYPNDIALLQLAAHLSFNGVTVASVQLPQAYFEVPQTNVGVEARLAGWGRNETYGLTQAILQTVTLQVYSDLTCYKRHAGDTTEQQICAGIDNGGMGQCTGDSGGPLIYGADTQLGIVSWSVKPCALPGYPGVYTKVSHYIDWLKSHINSDELNLTHNHFKFGRLSCHFNVDSIIY